MLMTLLKARLLSLYIATVIGRKLTRDVARVVMLGETGK